MRLDKKDSLVNADSVDVTNCIECLDSCLSGVECDPDLHRMRDISEVINLSDYSDCSRHRRVEWPNSPLDRGGQYRFASVSCAEKKCSSVGVQMLAEGGSAVDAAIAVSLAIGVERSLSSGIGGGGFMTYYSRELEESYILDYRETAPKSAYSTMYEDSNLNTKIGGGSIAVPGEVSGLWEAHQRFGKLKWSRLFEPAIEMAEKGIKLNGYLSRQLAKYYPEFDSTLQAIFTNTETGEIKKEGDTVVFTKLAETYRRIAAEGPETFYNGSLRDDIVADLEELDGQIVTAEDLAEYRTELRAPVTTTLKNGGYTVISPPPPSAGPVLQGILNILDGYHFTAESISSKREHIESTATTYHRVIEAMKFSYSTRMDLGDPKFSDVSEIVENLTDPEYGAELRSRICDDTTHSIEYYGATTDSRKTTGTSQISVLAGNGDAVSLTTSINACWGSKRMGKRTGIIFNNHMDDFSMPGTPSWTDDAWVAPSNAANWIEPGKRPLSAMCPSIVTDSNEDVILVTGGSGGAQITTATALTIINYLWFGHNLLDSVSKPRLHNQLLPNTIFYEKGFPEEYLEELEKKKHKLTPISFPPVTESVCSHNGAIFGVGDFRRLGGADGF